MKPYWDGADGSVAAGVAALSAFEADFSPELLRRFSCQLQQAPLVILDGNLPAEVLEVSGVLGDRCYRGTSLQDIASYLISAFFLSLHVP